MRSTTLWMMRFLPINKKRIMCVCWGGKKYNCNPKAITDALLRRQDAQGIQIVYAFDEPEQFADILPEGVQSVEIGSLQYYYLLATSHLIIANTRFVGLMWPFAKKSSQIYIQTQHGGHGIKKVELDVRDALTEEYITNAIEDTKRTDLMLSDSRYWTRVYRTAYQYGGEVLESGLPRNDVFFAGDEEKNALNQRALGYIVKHNSISNPQELSGAKFLIYTPTFRNNQRRDVYGFDVDKVVRALEERFGGVWYILVSSHPNMVDYYREVYDFSNPRLLDVGTYPELQELLVVSDVLITDYSSAEMDFSLTSRPVFQLIRDREDYDRGTYLDPRSLPFPYAENDDALVNNILTFDEEKYHSDLNDFNTNVIGLNETGHAADNVAEWIMQHI